MKQLIINKIGMVIITIVVITIIIILGILGYRGYKYIKNQYTIPPVLDSLEKIEYVEERRKSLLPLETSLRDIAEIAVSAEDALKLMKGQSLSPKDFAVVPAENLVAAK